ncbi:hypothetical protein ASE85_03275 [Sphingobium sp. Leaf26]|uniref:phage tail terminator-like protein n=1 Tax=Sphingobium sp. Leaf26 TaxID=1735693 RepID=UPI0006FEB0A9|nr:phage tail terminator-like protein [Sphingobium sp. Leaf26]KQN09965.1 hypothetical protein ASE85_03275 [Sphingobium sp. Leaf26]
MALPEDIHALRGRFLDEWSDLTPVAHDAAPALSEQADPWVRFSIRPDVSERRAFGHSYRQYGHVWLQIFVPRAGGDADAYELANAFSAIFRDWSNDHIECETPRTTTIGDDGKKWFQVNVSVEWCSTHWL